MKAKGDSDVMAWKRGEVVRGDRVRRGEFDFPCNRVQLRDVQPNVLATVGKPPKV